MVTWCSFVPSHHSLPPNFSLLAAARSSHCCCLRLSSSVQNNTQDTAHSAARVCTAWIKPVLGGGPLWFLTTSAMEVKRPSSLSWVEVLFGSSPPVGSEETKEPGLGWGSLPRPPSRHQRGAPCLDFLMGSSQPAGSEETTSRQSKHL